MRSVFRSLIVMAAVVMTSSSFAADSLLAELSQLDNDLIEITSTFYRDKSLYEEPARNVRNLDHLHELVEQHARKSDDITALRLLHNNESMVLDAFDNRAILRFLEIVLINNDRHMADSIAEAVDSSGDRSTLANVRFLFAKYYANRNAWSKVHELLNGGFGELPSEDAAYAYLLDGVALQEMAMHREAIERYDRVPGSSKYYTEAQLNKAVASIRQGWWTDAATIMRSLSTAAREIDRELKNRLHLVLGYALLQHEFYRNARSEFRKVTLDSAYVNRALLGIGLAATNQGDYVGAVNAFLHLKELGGQDLSTDESHLLLPYVYSRLNHAVTVTAGYSEAVTHYQKRLAALENLEHRREAFIPEQYDSHTGTLTIGGYSLSYGEKFPRAFLQNYGLLRKLVKSSIGTQQSARLEALLRRYDDAFVKVRGSLLADRIEDTRSYLNQARYGLANYFDSSSGAPTDD